MSDIPYLDIEIQREPPYQGIYDVLHKIRPKWKNEDIVIEKPTQGYVNLLLKCSVLSDPDDVIMLRLMTNIGRLNEKFDRESETEILCFLSQNGNVAPVYCKFTSGLAYKYLAGDRLTRDQLKDENILRSIAHRLHQVHQITVPKALTDKRFSILDILLDCMDVAMEGGTDDIDNLPCYKEHFPPVQELNANEIPKLKDMFEEVAAKYPVVLSHGDCHVHNTIYNQDTGDLNFVDWEVVGLYPEPYDAGYVIAQDPLNSGVFESPAARLKWLKIYLSTHPVHGKQPISDQMLQDWFVASLKCSAISTFAVAIFGIASLKVSPETVAIFTDFSLPMYIKYQYYLDQVSQYSGGKSITDEDNSSMDISWPWNESKSLAK